MNTEFTANRRLFGSWMLNQVQHDDSLHVILTKVRIHEHQKGMFTQSVFMDPGSKSGMTKGGAKMLHPLTGPMGDPRIIDIELDERSILRRNADIEQERRIAIFDLIESNRFDVAGHGGPYRVRLRVEEGRLAIAILDEGGAERATIRMGLARFRRPIRDYFQICDSYFRAVRGDGAKGIEAIDMARRALHNEAAELLQECLRPRVEMDFDTARRLFTLICVLHIKQSTIAVDSHGPGPASLGT